MYMRVAMNLDVSTGLNGSSAAAYLNFDTKNFDALLNSVEREVMPKAAVAALNRTAAVGRLEVQKEMELKLDAVTPYAKRGVIYEQANKDRLSATVMISGRSWGLKNSTPPANFLTPQFFGGQRNLKSFERQLQSASHLKSGEYAVPARDTPLDQYGNVRVALIVRILADLQVTPRTEGYNRKRSDASTKRNRNYRFARFFVPERNSHLHPGVWQRDPRDNGIKAVFLFVRMRPYTKRVDFFGVVKNVAEKRFGQFMAEEIGKRMKR
ncbi:hypothetical protein CES85_1055 [Ochrobactrum quorumnocens]|uniref:Uncharacterized protein n=2 Tax=Ochrobactrum quorumnocens TaxID=271865 RepID=A0A248UJS9_9HYPH|nr:hypothetical protein CES85_1055 [[Ochrobactrum] quorumnocens]